MEQIEHVPFFYEKRFNLVASRVMDIEGMLLGIGDLTKNDGKGIHWVALSNLCKPKCKRKLGFRITHASKANVVIN